MKLYDRVERIHNELRALGIADDAPLTVEQLVPFDQYHYHGTEAVDEAAERLGIGPATSVLDVGAGIGGPARWLAATTGCHVTALELQPDLDATAAAPDRPLRAGRPRRPRGRRHPRRAAGREPVRRPHLLPRDPAHPRPRAAVRGLPRRR